MNQDYDMQFMQRCDLLLLEIYNAKDDLRKYLIEELKENIKYYEREIERRNVSQNV